MEQVVRALGITHRYIEGFGRFRERVLEPSAREYMAGRTPNPCCDCNLLVKFGILADLAEELGAARVLTGHYAKLSHETAGAVLRRGDDPRKDQSYFLYRLTQRELGKLSFPVGAMEKSEVRRIAAGSGSSPRRSRTARTPVFRSAANASARRCGGSAAWPRNREDLSIAAGRSAVMRARTLLRSASARD